MKQKENARAICNDTESRLRELQMLCASTLWDYFQGFVLHLRRRAAAATRAVLSSSSERALFAALLDLFCSRSNVFCSSVLIRCNSSGFNGK
jgi:hypothetical protein